VRYVTAALMLRIIATPLDSWSFFSMDIP